MRHWLIIVLFIHGTYLFAEKTYSLDTAVNEINLKNYCYHFEDTTNVLSINQVLNQKWQKLDKNPTFPSNKYVQWLRYNFYNPYNTNLVRIIFIPYHLIHEIDVYTVSDSSIINISSTGIKRPYGDKHIKSIGYPVRIELKTHQTISVIIRLKHLYRPLRASTYLLTEQRVVDVILNNNNLIWFWRGVLLFAIFISLVIYISVKLKLFLYYFFLNVGFGIFIASQIGDYFLFFNIDSTDITSLIDFTGAILGILIFPLFLNALTPIKKRNEILWKWMYRILYVAIIIYIFNLFPSIRESIAMYYFHFYIMILSGLVLSVQLILLIKSIIYKDKNAIPLFIIYSIYIITMFVEIIFANMGIFADSPYVHTSLLLVSIFEIFAFMGLIAHESSKVYKERSELLEKQQEHQKQMIVSMVAGQEDARNRAGRELHDSIGANMAIIKRQIGKGNMDLYKIVSQTIDSVRTLSHGLVTPMVKNEEFVDEMRELCFLFSSEKFEVHCYFHNWPKIDNAKITTNLYRITQELLQNAVKHSEAKNAYLQFIGETNQSISLIYEDDGIGFNYSENEGKGLGLRNIENRVALLDGLLQFDTSTANKGCTIVIEVEL